MPSYKGSKQLVQDLISLENIKTSERNSCNSCTVIVMPKQSDHSDLLIENFQFC